MRPSKVRRGYSDVNTHSVVSRWNPFPTVIDIIRSRVIEGEDIYCHLSKEIGSSGMARICKWKFLRHAFQM